jgi:hypothetical protein
MSRQLVIGNLRFGLTPARQSGNGALAVVALVTVITVVVAGGVYYFANRDTADAYAHAHGGVVVMQERTIAASIKLIEKAFDNAVKAVAACEKASESKGDKDPSATSVAKAANARDEKLDVLDTEIGRALAHAPDAGARFDGFSRTAAVKRGLKVHGRAAKAVAAGKADKDAAKAAA